MKLDKVDFIYKGDSFHIYDTNHYEVFAELLFKRLKHQHKYLMAKDWCDIRENSLVIAFDYDTLHDDLEKLPLQNAHQFYRRIFVINWWNGHLNSPSDYQNKCFAGSLGNHAYYAIMNDFRADIDYSFYADSYALEHLREGAIGPNRQWKIGSTCEVGLYESVVSEVNLLRALGLYLSEYMEKYECLIQLNPLLTNHAKGYQSAIDILDEHSLDQEKPNSFAIKLADLVAYVAEKGGGSNLSNQDVSEVFTNYTIEEIALCVSQYEEAVFDATPLFFRDYVYPGDRIRLALVKLMAYAYNKNKNLTLDEYPAYISKIKAQIKTHEDLKEIKFEFPKIYSFMAQKAYKLGRTLEKDLLGNSEDGLLDSASSI